MMFVERTHNPESLQSLLDAGTHPVLARLFAARGLKDASELPLELKHLIPPSELKSCIEAANYLANALEAKKPLLIVADYDCDGATACAVGLLGLRELGQSLNAQIDFLVPNRFTMGYGLTPEVVDLAMQRIPQPAILITVDNGIASLAGIDRANQLGVEVLVTDHHLPADELPKAAVIVNPNQPECTFKSKSLAGVGVMFYVLLALRAELRQRGYFTVENQPKLEGLLDLVALGTVADVASLDRNNRILVSAGLRRMRQGFAQPGIKALFEIAKRDINKASAFDLGFGIGPRLNAAGRLADMTLGIRCLISKDPTEANHLAHELDRMNRERRAIEGDMQETALENLTEVNVDHLFSLCLKDESWHQGVIGILASRLKERYHRPVIIFAPGEDGSELKGSGRSINGFHLRDAIDVVYKKNPGLIQKFGGHAMAAGLTIQANDFDVFQKAFEEVAKQWLDEDTLHRRLIHDGHLDAAHIEPGLAATISQEVWGQGFPQPIFMGKFEITKQSLLKEKHLKLELRAINPDGKKGDVVQGIWFNHPELLPNEVSLAYRLVVDDFLGYPRTQLHIEAANLE
jgi:single-stranded-DNA-specific exonuclease